MRTRAIDYIGVLQSFSQDLERAGYGYSTVGNHMRFARQLLDWLRAKRAPMIDLNEDWITRFAHHVSHSRSDWSDAHHWRVCAAHSARLLLAHLRKTGLVVSAATPPQPQEPLLLTTFKQWMRQHRGTCDLTLYNYGIPIQALLRQLGEDPSRFNARRLRGFILKESQHCGWTVSQRCTTAVRAFVRYLIADGYCPAALEAAIPMLAHWRLSRLPRYLQPEEVERLIRSCAVTTAIGKRDRAILLLLARLGLRAGDIVQCRLTDIDWKNGWIHVSGKSRRLTRLPLTHEVGQAIVTYLQEARPKTDSENVFITCRAPYRRLSSHCAVSMLVRKAIRRAGVRPNGRGAAHLLRHSIASNLLRQGHSLQEIAALLRHRSIETTQIYAKVDVMALRQIVQPWPQVRSC